MGTVAVLTHLSACARLLSCPSEVRTIRAARVEPLALALPLAEPLASCPCCHRQQAPEHVSVKPATGLP